MVDELLGLAVFVGYGIVVSLALILAVVVFRTGDGGGDEAGSGRLGERSRAWWQRWR